MRLVFDRGTLLLADLPAGFQPGAISGVLWDARVGAFRAPARLAYAIASELRRRGVPIEAQPCPSLAPPAGFRPFELRPYQEAALAAWRQAGRRGQVVLPTGSGKTRIALGAIASTQTACLCLVPTRVLLEQWTAALGAIWDGRPGQFGDGLRVLGPITVATFASAYRHMPRLGDKFGLLVVDEAHHFGHGTRDEALEMSIAPLRLGLTATPPAPGPAAKRLGALIGPVVFERTIGDLAGRYLAPLERITWWLALDPDERREHDALWEVYRQARRAFEGNHLAGNWEDFLREAARTDEGRRGIAAWRRARQILAFPRRKREALALLLGRHRAQRTLVFVADNETAYRVAREHLIMPLTCDIGRGERQQVLARFQAGALRALVSAQVLNEGLDVPDAEVGIVVAGRLGEREHLQRVGRLLRPGEGKRALVYELVVERSSEVRQSERRWESFAFRARSAA
ncbi:MAG TPA: DEAD/DEAH box helicase family protein [Polyangia bacterium]|nr:DEAD/DEAH box helicase family protein [Polyangia bacterium]